MRRGFCWKGLYGDGFICGYVDPIDGSFSGDDLAYIYPDFKTALRYQKDGSLSVPALVFDKVLQTKSSMTRDDLFDWQRVTM